MKELEEAKHQLSAEQNKVFKLEVELAEAQQRLQQVTDLEKELAHYRCRLHPENDHRSLLQGVTGRLDSMFC